MRNERWSEEKEIKKVLREDGGNGQRVGEVAGGPVLYYQNKRRWCYTDEGHLIFLGVSGSGKSRRGTIPMIRNFIHAGESFITVDPKGEIFNQTACYLSKEYNTHVIDFRHVLESERWNPLRLITELYHSEDLLKKQVAMESLDDLAYALYEISGQADPFWIQSARSVFIGAVYALMEYGDMDQLNMANVYQLIARGEERFGGASNTYLKEFVKSLPSDSITAMMLQSYATTAEDTRGGIRSTFLEGISIFARSEGLISMLGGDDLHINALDGEKPVAIYIILPDESAIYDGLSGVLVGQLMGHYLRLAQDKFHGKLPCRLNVCLEELGNIGGALSSLPHLMSAGRSRNIRCQLVLQSLSQLDTIYGPSKASTIRSNADVLVAFRMNHWETLVELSNKCGEREINRGGYCSREHLISPAQLAAMKTGQALVMISGRTKFISWLPDYSEMYDCSDWKAPSRILRGGWTKTSVFDIQKYVREKKKKEIQESRNSMSSPSPFFSDFD